MVMNHPSAEPLTFHTYVFIMKFTEGFRISRVHRWHPEGCPIPNSTNNSCLLFCVRISCYPRTITRLNFLNLACCFFLLLFNYFLFPKLIVFQDCRGKFRFIKSKYSFSVIFSLNPSIIAKYIKLYHVSISSIVIQV